MSFLETIIRELSSKFGIGAHSGALAMEALRTITSERTGGLGGFISRFQNAGFGNLVASWIGKGENMPVAPRQLEEAVGPDFISTIASKVGLPAATAGPALAYLVPKLIDKLTPEGKVPSVLPAEATALLSGGTAGTASAAGTRPAYTASSTPERKRGGLLRKLIPLLGLLLLGLLAYWFFGRGGEYTAESTPRPSATATAPTADAPAAPAPKVAATANPSQLALQNADGRILYSGTVPDGQSQSRIVDALNSVFGASAVSGSLAVDPAVAPPAWLDKLAAALGQFKIPGAEMLLKGDSIDIGGLLSDETRNKLIASLKPIFGEGFSVGTLTESLAGALAAAKAMVPESGASTEAAQAANDKVVAALKGVSSGYSADDLVKVLNASVVTFESGSAVISAADEDLLRSVANGISGAPAGSMIEIGGHTDSTGDAEANLALSQARAAAVRDELVRFGSSPAMLSAKGYGGTRPVASNDTAEGREQNRRIEFTVVK